MRRIRRLSKESPHSIEQHNRYIKDNRYNKKCPLCERGSKVVHESLIGDKK